MKESILKNFLLFHFSDWSKYIDQIVMICQLSLLVILLISVIFTKLSENPEPVNILKRVILAQFVLFLIPNYLPQTIHFGFEIGDEIIKNQKNGIISNWVKAQEEIKKEAKKKKKEIGWLDSIKNFFHIPNADIFDKGVLLLILFVLSIVKIIYSIIYYSSLLMAPAITVISVIPFFKSYNISIIRSALFLIIEVVVVALILVFMNKVLVVPIGEDGKIMNTISSYVQFLVLSFALLGSFAITKSIVSGGGPESWGSKMGSMLGAGLAYNALSKAQNAAMKSAGIGGGAALGMGAKALSGVVNHGKNGLKNIASPVIEGGKSVKESLKQKAQNSASNIPGIKDTPSNDSYLKAHGINPESVNQANKGPSNYSEALKNRVTKEDGTTGLRKSLNPINHLKATKDLAGSKLNTAKSNLREQMGVPEGSSNLGFKDRAVLATNRVLNGKDAVKNIPATRPGLNNAAKAPSKVSSSKPISNKQVPNIKKNEPIINKNEGDKK